MQWLGLNWTDILLGASILAIIPFALAAYGGHLAAETITDKKQGRKTKAKFWLMCVLGIVLALWQQIRAAVSDEDREARATWAEALLLKNLNPPPSPPAFAYGKPTSAPAQTKPDLLLQIGSKASPAGTVTPVGGVVATNAEVLPVLWDLDGSNHEHTLPLRPQKYDWIRSDQLGGPMAFLYDEDRKGRDGHRIFGYVTVTCPNCKHVRSYWVYCRLGEGGWYSELPGYRSPDIKKVADAIPLVRQNKGDAALVSVPLSSRLPIKEIGELP